MLKSQHKAFFFGQEISWLSILQRGVILKMQLLNCAMRIVQRRLIKLRPRLCVCDHVSQGKPLTGVSAPIGENDAA